MIFMSYNQQTAQEGLRLLESIVNNQSNITKPVQYELRNDVTAQGNTDESTSDELYKKLLLI